MKGYCISCSYFRRITKVIGYCNILGVMMEDEVVILDTIDTLRIVNDVEKQKIYTPIVVQCYFGCSLFEDKNAKLQLL